MASGRVKVAATQRIIDAVKLFNAQDSNDRWPVYFQARKEYDARRLTMRAIGDLLVGMRFALDHGVVRSRLRDIAPDAMAQVAAVMNHVAPLPVALRDTIETCCTAIENLIAGPRKGLSQNDINAFGRVAQDQARETLRRLLAAAERDVR